MSLWTSIRDSIIRPLAANALEQYVPGGGLIADVTGIRKGRKKATTSATIAQNAGGINDIVTSLKGKVTSPEAKKLIDAAIAAEKTITPYLRDAAQQRQEELGYTGGKSKKPVKTKTPTNQKMLRRSGPTTEIDTSKGSGTPTNMK